MKRAVPVAVAAAAALALLPACTAVGHEKVADWPDLMIVEHHVSAGEVYERCSKYVAWGMLPMACAEFNLATRRCDIWYIDAFVPRSVVEHERLHCQGHDHVGETAMRDFLARYRTATAGAQAAAGAAAPASNPSPAAQAAD